MIRMTLIVEDTYIDAEYGDNGWCGKVVDLPTGKTQFIEGWTIEQMGAAVSLSLFEVGENKTPGYDTEVLYGQIAPLVENWPQECRFIP